MQKEIKINREKTAIIIVDMQNSYCHPKGSIGRNGYNIKMMTEAIPKVKELVQTVRENNMLDIWVTQNHHLDDLTKQNRLITPHTHRWDAGPPAVKNSWESEVVNELQGFLNEETEVIKKHRFSAFFDTRLDTLLRMKGITTLIISGVATTHCVETTVRDAYQRDYDVIIAKDAIGGMSVDDHNASLSLMNKVFGVALDNQDINTLLQGESIPYNMTTESLVK